MPMPQLKVRSSSGTPALEQFASHPKTAGGAHAEPSTAQRTPAGSTRGKFSGSPPPVMWQRALTYNRDGGVCEYRWGAQGKFSGSPPPVMWQRALTCNSEGGGVNNYNSEGGGDTCGEHARQVIGQAGLTLHLKKINRSHTHTPGLALHLKKINRSHTHRQRTTPPTPTHT